MGKRGSPRGSGSRGKGNQPARAMIRIPAGADWFVWRLVLSEHFNASKVEIESKWTLAETMQAHLFLDRIEALRDS
jgi:hypothetical protein